METIQVDSSQTKFRETAKIILYISVGVIAAFVLGLVLLRQTLRFDFILPLLPLFIIFLFALMAVFCANIYIGIIGLVKFRAVKLSSISILIVLIMAAFASFGLQENRQLRESQQEDTKRTIDIYKEEARQNTIRQ